MLSFAGWVPTITGQLSFSLIGLRSATLNCVTANFEQLGQSVVPHRTMVSIVRRVARDVPWPIRLFHPSRIKHCVVLGATSRTVRPSVSSAGVSVHTDELGLFRGQVHVIPHHKNRIKRARAAELVKSIRTEIADFRKGGDINALRTSIEDNISKVYALRILSVEFELYRTGELRINADPHLPQDLCDQVYYLVKDMAHHHYHHSHADDSLLPLTPVSSADDQSWRRKTLWSLARIVLEARRRDRLEGYKSALGMLAYAEAFQGLLGRVFRTGVGPAQFDFVTDTPNYDFAHTRSSLEAKIAEREYKLSARSQSFALWISTVIATIALWISAVQIATPICEAIKSKDKICQANLPHLTSHAIKFLIERPHEVYGLFLVVVLLYLGRRTLSLVPVAFYEYLVVGWSQALGASASRAAGANDRLGQIVVIATTLLIGSVLMVLAGAASGVLPLQAMAAWLATHLHGLTR